MKPGYKQTEIGVIPEEWEVRPLLSTVRIANGQVSPKVEPYTSMVLVAPDHIQSSTGRLLAKETATEQGAISGKYLFERGDIVYSKIRPYLRKAILADFSGLCSADMYPLKPSTDISAGYILAVILGYRFSKYVESVSVRSGMPKINRTEMADFSLAVPPLPEQRAISEALGDVDGLIGSLERRWDGGIKWCMPTDITGCQDKYLVETERTISRLGLNSSGTQLLPAGALLLCSRATIGEIKTAACEVCTNQGFKSLVCHPGVSNEYLYYKMLTMKQQMIERAFGSTFLEISKSNVAAIKLSIPLLPEQTAIAEVLTDIDVEIGALARSNAQPKTASSPCSATTLATSISATGKTGTPTGILCPIFCVSGLTSGDTTLA